MEMVSDFDQLLGEASETFGSLDTIKVTQVLNRPVPLRPSLTLLKEFPSLKPMVDQLRSIGPKSKFILENPSSDEESDDDSCFPSVKHVVTGILDTINTSITTQYDPSSYHPPALIFFNLDPWLSAWHVASALSKFTSSLLRSNCVDFYPTTSTSPVHCAVAYIKTIEAGNWNVAQSLYTKLQKEEEKGTLAAILHRIPGVQLNVSARWLNYKVFDPSNDWTALILRGISKHMNIEIIKWKLGELAVRIEPLREINGAICTIVVVKNLEFAEKIMRNYENYNIGGKVDIHPYSSLFKRPDLLAPALFRCKSEPKIEKRFKGLESVDTQEEEEKEEVLEDGEISDEEMKGGMDEHSIFEFSGVYFTREGNEMKHSGVLVKTFKQIMGKVSRSNAV